MCELHTSTHNPCQTCAPFPPIRTIPYHPPASSQYMMDAFARCRRMLAALHMRLCPLCTTLHDAARRCTALHGVARRCTMLHCTAQSDKDSRKTGRAVLYSRRAPAEACGAVKKTTPDQASPTPTHTSTNDVMVQRQLPRLASHPRV